MGLQPKINGKTVERAYEDYRNGIYLVNRRYQRKLVWNKNEKEAFVDSLKNGYPVPLFLFSHLKQIPYYDYQSLILVLHPLLIQLHQFCHTACLCHLLY